MAYFSLLLTFEFNLYYSFILGKTGQAVNYLGDKYCDDENNMHLCNYDGGDCCAGEDNPVIDEGTYQFCTECECKCENIHNYISVFFYSYSITSTRIYR